MNGRVGKLETVVDEFRGRFEAIDQRFEAIDRRFEGVDRRFDAIDQTFVELEERLSTKIAVQGEYFEDLARTLADNLGGAIEGVARELSEFRGEMRDQTRFLSQTPERVLRLKAADRECVL